LDSQYARLATHQAIAAEDHRIAHIGPAHNKPEGDIASRRTRCALPLADRPEVWTD